MITRSHNLVVALKNDIKDITDALDSESTQAESNQSIEAREESGIKPPPLKKFRHLSDIISQKLREAQQVDKGIAATIADTEVQKFCELRFSIPTPCNKDGLAFWIDLESSFPNLSHFAEDMMVVPASSTPIERTFSVAGYCCIGKRNRLTNSNLEREIMIKTNEQYI